MRYLFIFCCGVVLIAGCANDTERDFPSQKPWYSSKNQETWAYAIRDGRTITVMPIKAEFKIPVRWVSRYKRAGNNIHITRHQLDKIALPKGQWDPEFASVCNRIFPFDRCAVHVGDGGWGSESSSYRDLQLRVYDLAGSVAMTKKKIKKEGLKELQRITGATMKQLEGENHFREFVEKKWHVVQLTFWRLYSYYSDATVDCRLKRVADRTLVFVFMYTDPKQVEGEIKSILASFQAKSK